MIRIDAFWLDTEPMDMRAGTGTALARVITVFGAAKPHCTYLFASRRARARNQPECATGAQLYVGDLDASKQVADQQPFFAPVKMKGFTERKRQRYKSEPFMNIQRQSLHNELHARPSLYFEEPAHVYHLAFIGDPFELKSLVKYSAKRL